MALQTTPDLSTLIDAIDHRAEEVSANATPKDIVFLAKAVEAMTGSVALQQVRDEGASQTVDLIGTGDTQTARVIDAGDQAVTTINALVASSGDAIATQVAEDAVTLAVAL